MFFSDGRIEYKELYYKKGKEITISELENYFHLNRQYKGYHIVCTCFEQGSTSFLEALFIYSQIITLHSQYISINFSNNKITASTTISEMVNNVFWTVYPIGLVSMVQ